MNGTKESLREINKSFASEIKKNAVKGVKPAKDVISFRSDKELGKEREVWFVPINLLRYRKDNGRIASDVLSYEKENNVVLDENDQSTQVLLRKFLYEKDIENTTTLINAIRCDGQDEPAIVTCDGFLINGNRRKMALEELCKEKPDKFSKMKVIILPDGSEPGDPLPTIRDIEIIENKYQLSRDGKSEYKGLDRALSIARKMSLGISLDEQLLADTDSSGDINSKVFKKKKSEWMKNYLNPLAQAEQYLDSIGRPGHYTSIEGRWQSFTDLSNFYNSDLTSEKWRLSVNIDEDDIGMIQDIAFKLIRKQSVPGRSQKAHQFIRDLPRFIADPDARQSILMLHDKVVDLSLDEKKNLTYEEQDRVWGSKEANKNVFAQAVNTAYTRLETKSETESSLALIKAIDKKVHHKNMNVDNILHRDLKDFIDTTDKVIRDITRLKKEAWDRYKAKNNAIES